MDAEVIVALDQVTPEWLTAVLLKSRALTGGRVAGFEVDTGRGNWSTNARLNLRYAPGSKGALPERLFLKLVNTDLDDEYFGPSEVTYYTRDYVDVAGAPIVRCYSAAYSEQLHRYHLLLDDLSATHISAVDKAPTLEYGLALAEGLATMHARWWGAPRLAEAGEPIHDAAHIRRFVKIAEPGAGYILDQYSHALKPHWPDTIREIYERHPAAMIARTQDDNGFTLIHGDAGPYNILVPRDGDRPIYLLDRQPFEWSLTTWLGVYDLIHAIVLDWDSETRRRLEMQVLRSYHDWLVQKGITGYSWERLYDDYRLTMAIGVYIATEYCRGGINEPLAWVWLPMLQNTLAAIDDLNCSQLW